MLAFWEAAYLETDAFQWERYIVRGSVEAVAIIQAALIGQTFGLLSGVIQTAFRLVRRKFT